MKCGRKTEVGFNARPHPDPLPRGEGEAIAASKNPAGRFRNRRATGFRKQLHEELRALKLTRSGETMLPLLGERAGVRAVQTTI